MYNGYNLQGIIRRNVVNTMHQFEKFGYYSQNIGNAYTHGYKAIRFDDVLDEQGYVSGALRTNHAQGAFQITQNPLDVGIKGAGFIPITSLGGEIYYTRDGSFALDKNGYLVTTSGDLVGGGIRIDASSAKVEIRKNGEVYTYKDPSSEGVYCGTIPLVQFANPDGLEECGKNRYSATEKSGEISLVEDHNRIAQYGIERSNVDIFATVDELMRLNTSLLASTSLMSAIGDMYDKAINIRE